MHEPIPSARPTHTKGNPRSNDPTWSQMMAKWSLMRVLYSLAQLRVPTLGAPYCMVEKRMAHTGTEGMCSW